MQFRTVCCIVIKALGLFQRAFGDDPYQNMAPGILPLRQNLVMGSTTVRKYAGVRILD